MAYMGDPKADAARLLGRVSQEWAWNWMAYMSGPFVVGPFGTPWPIDLAKAAGWIPPVKAPDISEADTIEIKLPVCTANPSCGEDDVICPQCRAGNCPGVKCWRGCGG